MKDKTAAQKDELRYAFEEIDFLVAGMDFKTALVRASTMVRGQWTTKKT